jgi:hypothetical protein
MRKPDRQDACPTEQNAEDFMVGQVSSLSIGDDGQDACPRQIVFFFRHYFWENPLKWPGCFTGERGRDQDAF